MVIAHNSISHAKVRTYFDHFPIYSYKYLACKDWKYVQDIRKSNEVTDIFTKLTAEEIREMEYIKGQFNSKRKLYDFSPLESLTL